MQVDRLLCDDTPAVKDFQEAFTALQHAVLPPQLWHPTQLPDERLEASCQERQCIVDALALLLAQSGRDTTSMTIAVVTGCGRAAALMHEFCGMPQEGAFAVEVQPASISCIDVAHHTENASLADGATVHCLNSRAHLTAGLATVACAANGTANVSDV
jgi:hypothetical protein